MANLLWDLLPQKGRPSLRTSNPRTEDAWKSMESGVDAASQGVQNASDQVARTLGFSGAEGERLARQSGQNVEAITKCGTVLTQACQRGNGTAWLRSSSSATLRA